jgi:hypothetical protein
MSAEIFGVPSRGFPADPSKSKSPAGRAGLGKIASRYATFRATRNDFSQRHSAAFPLTQGLT